MDKKAVRDIGGIQARSYALLMGVSVFICGCGGGGGSTNSAPTATAMGITDDNAGSVVVGDSLTGTYTYDDVDGDAEGLSTFRWLRDGLAISGATASTYTLVAADSGTAITFEVTPVAASGAGPGSAVISSGLSVGNSAPTATGLAITDDNAGSVVVPDSLTGSYTYGDVDGDAEGTTTFRWLRDGLAISGATASTYTLVAADSGTAITFEVTPVASSGGGPGSAATSGGLSVVNSAPTATGVGITDDNAGSVVVPDNLTGNYTYGDVDGDVEGTSTFRWLRDGLAISGAMASTYTLVAADSGTAITFEVTTVAASGAGPGSAVTSSGLAVVNSAPTATGVGITDDNGGTAVVGDSLTGNYTYGDVDGDAEGASTFRWLRDGTAISGATASTYSVVVADSGTVITFEVTPVAVSGAGPGSTVTSSGLSVVNSAPIATGVGITDDNGGSVVVPDSLTGSYTYSDVDGDLQGSTTFRWLRDGTAISGATASTYTLVAADSGTAITFEVTPVAASGAGPGLAATSSGLSVVNSAPTATAVSITDDNGGSVVVPDSLTGNYTYGDVDLDVEGTSTFRWLRDGSAISGATASTYTLVPADGAKTITFEVTPVAASGAGPGSAVTSSGVLVVNFAPTATGVGITDDNAGYAEVGDSLTGDYTYSDVDGDLQGTSTFRWLRDGSPISGATSSTYTLVSADDVTTITFEVTPVAATGITTGSAVTSSGLAAGTPPVVSGVARFLDVNKNAVCDANDQLIVPFDQDVTVNSAVSGDFNLPVTGDAFGAGATVVAGPASNEVTITLGTSPSLKSRQDYTGTTTSNSPSGIDVSGSIGAGVIYGGSGIDAAASTAIDIAPMLVDAANIYVHGAAGSADLGDLDGDGDLDMILGLYNGIAQSNQVWFNDGAGTFTESGQMLGITSTWSVVLGDIDSDGDLDVVFGNEDSVANRVWTNDGSGTFTDSGQSLGSSSTQEVKLGDLDGDGDLDLVAANTSGQPERVYTNDGAGVFTDSGQALGTLSTRGLELGDVDQDGDLDIVLSGLTESRVWLNDGTGTFTDSGQTINVVSGYDCTLGDFDGDGDLDLAIAGGGLTTPDEIWWNDGSGTFSDSGQALGASITQAMASLDIDGDGDLDLLAGGWSSGTGKTQVYLNNGTGTFSESGQALHDDETLDWAIGDVDGDGDFDAMQVTFGPRLLRNSLSGTWGSASFTDSGQSLGTYASWSFSLGDLDGDGDLDMAVANSSLGDRVYTNDGSGTLTDTAQSHGTDDSRHVTLGDLDGDGDLDMAVAIYGGNRVYTNDGSGSMTDSAQSLGANSSRSLSLGDVDGDGDLDMVVANFGMGNRVYTNDGLGSFTDSGQSLGTNSSTSIALGDVDGDGDLDMVVANYAQADRVYTNDGLGIFTDSAQSLGGSNTRSLYLGDVDGDGDLDMVEANYGQANRVYTNDGTGTFTNTLQALGTSNSWGIALGDVDGDGDLDMAVANFGQGNRVYTNDGAGIFTDSTQSLGANDSSFVALADLDGDGDIDLVTGNNGQGNRVYRNQ